MGYLIKNWPILLVAISSIVAVIGTLISNSKDSVQKDNIEALGKETVNLSFEIKTLQNVNNEISKNVVKIISANTELSKENIELTQQTKQLIAEVQKLTNQIDKNIQKEEAENLQSGELHLKLNSGQKNIKATIGGMTAVSTISAIQNGAHLFHFGEEDPLKFRFENEKMFFNMKIIDRQGKLIAEIVNNFWRPNRNFTGKFNYDDTGFEVIDNEGNIAVNIDFVENNEIRVQGIFPVKSENMLIIAGRATMQLEYNISDEDFKSKYKASGIKQLFEYTGSSWLHKRK